MEHDVYLLHEAMEFAMKAHILQKDKAGQPYILHPLQVMLSVQKYGFSYMIAAVLHDVVEDTEATIEDIELEFGYIISVAVDALTKRKGEDYTAYLNRVKGNHIAWMVKIADIQHNMDESRINWEWTSKDHARMTKYANALQFLRLVP